MFLQVYSHCLNTCDLKYEKVAALLSLPHVCLIPTARAVMYDLK